MPQLNLNTTPDFERDLDTLMKRRGIKSKAEAIRVAVHEASGAKNPPLKRDFSGLIGLVDRVPGPLLSDKSGEELLGEIDREMDEKLDRLAGNR